MKRSASYAELSLDEEEPLDAAGDAVEPTQLQILGNVGEGSVQEASGVALHQSTQAGLGLESCTIQDVSRDAVQANRGVAAQPTEAGLGLEFHNIQEQPNVEELAIQASSGVAVQLTQAGSRLELLNFEEQPNVEEGSTHPICGAVVQSMQAGLGLESQNFQEQPNGKERGGVGGLQPTQEAHPSPLIQGNDTVPTLTDEQIRLIVELAKFVFCNTKNLKSVAETSHLEEESGSNDGSVPQTPPSDMDDLENGQGEASHQEEAQEEADIHDRIGLQALPIDMDNLRRVGWIELADLDEPLDAEEDVIQAWEGEQEMQGLDEAVDDEADSGIQVRAGQPIQMREDTVSIDEIFSIDDIHETLQALTDEEISAQIEEFVQSVSCDTNNPRNGQAGASHPEEETGSNDGSMPQSSPSDMNDLRNGQGETSHHEEEEEAGFNDRIGPQASPVDLNKPMEDEDDIVIQARAGQQHAQGLDELADDEEDSGIQAQAGQQQMRDAPPKQGTAGRRMRLQVPLCGAEGPIEQNVFGLPQVRELACLLECI